MSETSLTLETANEVLNLDDLRYDDEGVEAGPGATGFGLPPIAVQWAEGAGDGATYRGQRTLARDMDIPLQFVTKNRDALLNFTRKLGRMLSERAMTLRFSDGDEEWTLPVYRTGGGDFNYGLDTDGATILSTVLTVTAGQPYWQRATLESGSLDAAGIANGDSLPVTNTGSARAYPTWTLQGPAGGLTAYGPDGRGFSWQGSLQTGETVTINTATGEVRDSNGNDRYSDMAPAPQLFPIQPGSCTLDVAASPFVPTSRYNYCTNPYMMTWGDNKWVPNPYSQVTLGIVNGSSVAQFKPLGTTTGKALEATWTITGLTAGQSYRVRLELQVSGSGGYAAVPITVKANNVSQSGTAYTFASWKFDRSVTADASGNIAVKVSEPAPSSSKAPTPYNVSVLYVGDAGANFSGDTPDTATTDYSWTGAAGQSISKATPLGDTAPKLVKCEWTPLDWMVI